MKAAAAAWVKPIGEAIRRVLREPPICRSCSLVLLAAIEQARPDCRHTR